jgi:hypothetical protein
MMLSVNIQAVNKWFGVGLVLLTFLMTPSLASARPETGVFDFMAPKSPQNLRFRT